MPFLFFVGFWIRSKYHWKYSDKNSTLPSKTALFLAKQSKLALQYSLSYWGMIDAKLTKTELPKKLWKKNAKDPLIDSTHAKYIF